MVSNDWTYYDKFVANDKIRKMKYSQNNEQKVILDYFGKHKGSFLDVGANDGRTLSNTLALAERGWKGVCVEPSPEAYYRLVQEHAKRHDVYCYNYALSGSSGIVKLHHSGTHFNNGDVSLLSTMHEADRNKWQATTTFKTIEVEALSFADFISASPYKHFDFISIDAEGEDWNILQQLDLSALECKALCIEHNGDDRLVVKIGDYCEQWGLTNILLFNGENIILAL